MSHKDSKELQTSEEPKIGRRRFFQRGGFLAGLTAAAAAFSLVPFTPAHAASTTGSSGLAVKTLSRAKAQQYIQATLASQDYKRFEQEVSQNYAGTLVITKTEASALEVVSEGKSLIIARIPINGGAGNSFYGATISPDTGALLFTISGLFTFTPQGNIHAVGSSDGRLLFEGTFTPDGNTIMQGTLYTLNETKVVQGHFAEALPHGSTRFWSCLSSCLKGLGINGNTISIAISGCSALCTFNVAVCTGCFIIALAAGGSAVAACVASCAASYGL